MKVGFVIPTLNEETNLMFLLPELRKEIPNATIIIVDDISTDKTVDVARKYRALVPYTFRRRGLGVSYAEGLGKAYYEHDCRVIVQLDADHPTSCIVEMIETLKKDKLDMIIGHEMGTRTITSNVASWLARNLLGLNFKQPTCGFMVFTKDFLERLNLRKIKSKGDAFHMELLFEAVRMGAKIGEVDFKGKTHEKASIKRSLFWLWEFLKILSRRIF